MAVEEIRFSLALSARRWLRFYQGSARAVIVRAHDGRTVQFPAHHLRPFVSREGVYGEFVLRVDGGRLIALERVA